jgi:outer membrane protein OmpA-like peptidoglycan-associated protein
MSKRARKTVMALTVFSVLLQASGVRAQMPPTDGLDVQVFRPAVGGDNYVSIYGAAVPGHLGFGAGLLASYASKPFVLYTSQGGDPVDGAQTALVKNFLTTEFYGYLGVTEYLSIGLSMPLALYMSGEVPTDPVVDSDRQDLDTFAWGDAALHVKGNFYTLKAAGLSFGAVLSVTVPTGKYAKNFFGKKNVGFVPRAIVEFSHSIVSAAVNLGAVLRAQPVRFYNETFEIGQQFLYGAAVGVEVYDDISVLAEMQGRTAFDAVDTSPLEAGGAIRWDFYRGFGVDVGGSAGVLAGIGAPVYRVYLGFRWSPTFKDSDGDGVADDEDKCPGQKEDRDGFMDGDGCPDLDNDRDAVPDNRDKCPRTPEDFDGYQDNDGCPDADNDGDKICDANTAIQQHLAKYKNICTGKDNCPMHRGPADQKGCPADMLDTDEDGVPDARDGCVEKAEDRDGFKDDDGCPDPDNDGDGVCDPNDAIQSDLAAFAKVCKGKDSCPAAAEDKDGHKDDDGCPDPDDDGDGVCDKNPVIQKNVARFKAQCIGADRCPKKKETINGRRDTDGCPDRGRPDLVLKGKQILTPRRKVRFKRLSTKFGRGSERVLRQLAMQLRIHGSIQKVVIVAFTDTLLGKQKALEVSQAWADKVKKTLIAYGIAADRLTAKGLGKVKPIYKGRSRRKQRRVNRRVEFYIVRQD